MPVQRKKKDTTTNLAGSTPEQTIAPLPDQQTFQHYLRVLARSGMRTVLEEVMRSSGWVGENAAPSVKAIAMAPTVVIR
jgi:hypothetical protein